MRKNSENLNEKGIFRVGFFKWKLSKCFELMKFSVISFIIFTFNSSAISKCIHIAVLSHLSLSLVFFCQSIFFFIHLCRLNAIYELIGISLGILNCLDLLKLKFVEIINDTHTHTQSHEYHWLTWFN